VTMATAPLRGMSLDDLAEVFHAADEVTCAAILAETDRRDRLAKVKQAAARRRTARTSKRAAWEESAYAQYLDASAVCAGHLLSRRGIAAGVSDWPGLWEGTAAEAQANGSEELQNFWRESPRVTLTAYQEQQREAARIERDDADRAAMDAVDTETAYEISRDGEPCGRVTQASVRHRGHVVTAWWAILPCGAMTLHADVAGAVAAVLGMRWKGSRHLPQRYGRGN
jgi:hypothetical protein